MDASTTFSLRSAEGSDAKAEKSKQATLPQIELESASSA